MKKIIANIDGMSKIFKILLALPFLDIFWAVYRAIKSSTKDNTLGVILGILLIIFGIPFLWIIDLITIIFFNKVIWVD